MQTKPIPADVDWTRDPYAPQKAAARRLSDEFTIPSEDAFGLVNAYGSERAAHAALIQRWWRGEVEIRDQINLEIPGELLCIHGVRADVACSRCAVLPSLSGYTDVRCDCGWRGRRFSLHPLNRRCPRCRDQVQVAR